LELVNIKLVIMPQELSLSNAEAWGLPKWAVASFELRKQNNFAKTVKSWLEHELILKSPDGLLLAK